ncbi:MAG TPA: chemotaxis protein CheX [Acidisarcina sp.]|nr:chemotaxis protein CheX [Acidisarcina sp.]
MQTVAFEPTLADAAAEVLESMCFTEILGDGPEGFLGESQWVSSTMEFQGVARGRFGLQVSADAARTLAANFYGQEPHEVNADQICDVIGELTNMVCGAALNRLEKASSFHLSHPESTIRVGKLQPFHSDNCSSRILQLEDGFLSVWLELVPE